MTLWSSFLWRPLQLFVYWLGGYATRDENQWAFGAWSGTRFADNSAALFLHCADHAPPGVEVAWITAQPEIRDELRGRGYRAYTMWSRQGIRWALRSGVFVYDSLPKDVNFWLSRGARLVLLRHGIGIKKVQRAIDVPSHRLFKLYHGNPIQQIGYRMALPWHIPTPDLVFSTSEEHADQAPRYFGVDRSQVRVTGAPRLDRLVDGDHGSRPPYDRFANDDPVFLFMPTFREGRGRQIFPWPELAAAADEASINILVKLHPIDASRGVVGDAGGEANGRIAMADSTIDPVLLYPAVDGLITDFSSAYFDFLLLDRPIIYYMPDLESFTRSRSLIGDIDDLVAGPVATDVAGLAEALIASADDFPRYADQRRRLVARFHHYGPGGASGRVMNEILESIQAGWRRPSELSSR